MGDSESQFVSRGGKKLSAALDGFGLEVKDYVCADLGCNVGGFTDCLLQRGAREVYAVDTGYGALAYALRKDDRVHVLERTNAMHLTPPVRCIDLVVIDLAWTRQIHALPAAQLWEPKKVVTLIKPHYEAPDLPKGAILSDSDCETVTRRTLGEVMKMGWQVKAWMWSPIRGGAGKGKLGNREALALLSWNGS